MACTNSINPNSGKDLLIKIGNNFSGAVTLTITTNLVGATAHGLESGDPIMFSSVVTTTTVDPDVVYYVINPLANTFQLSLTRGGSVLAIDATGSATAVETYGELTGLSSTTISEAATIQEITNKSSNNFREILDQAGIKSMSVSGSGFYSSDWAQDKLRTLFLAQQINSYQIFLVPEDSAVLKYWEGCFKIASMENTGELDASQQFSASFESSGAFTYNEVVV
jgi:predicted secreted protein